MSRTDTASRVISAPPDGVYAALTDPDVFEDPAFHGTMTMTWEVTAVDARSRVDSKAEDVPKGINAADHAAGLSSSLENLAA